MSPLVSPLGFGASYAKGLHELLEKGAAEFVDSIVAEVDGAAEGIEIERRVVEGAPARVLMEAAEDAALLVVGSRGLGGFGRLLLGSVGQQCAQHAPCPVVIVRDSTPKVR